MPNAKASAKSTAVKSTAAKSKTAAAKSAAAAKELAKKRAAIEAAAATKAAATKAKSGKGEGADKPRCAWAGDDPLYVAYHDTEWGVPVYDDRVLFEFLLLEGAQAGLSWITILRKREAYRKAFAGFDPEKVARFDAKKIAALLQDQGIVRNRLKVESAVKNARAFLQVQSEFGSFSDYQWRFVGGKPLQNARAGMAHIPARTAESDAFSKDLKKRGFNFVGSTIIYAHMQAVGMANDHVDACFRQAPVSKLGKKR